MGDRKNTAPAGTGNSPSVVTAAPMGRIQTYSTTPIRAAPQPVASPTIVSGSATSPGQASSPLAKASPAAATPPQGTHSSQVRKDDRKSIVRSHSSLASPSAGVTPTSTAPPVHPNALHMSTTSIGSPSMAPPVAAVAQPPAGLVLTPGAHPLSQLETELVSQRPLPDDITADAEGLKSLMRRDYWAATIKLSERCIAEARSPHELLQYRLCRLVALLKLRQYKLLKEEIDALGDLESSPTYTYENYPTYYPNKRGSFVPFTLRLIAAWIPGLLGHSSQTLDALYSLLNRCRAELQSVTASRAIKTSAVTHPNTSHTASAPRILSSEDIPVVPLTPSPTPNQQPSAATTSTPNSVVSSELNASVPLISSPLPSLHASISDHDLETVLSGTSGSPMPPSTPLASLLDLPGTVFGMPASPAVVSPSITPASDHIEEQLRLWQSRETRITLAIATRLMMDKEFPTAVQVLEELIARNPSDVTLQSALGRAFLHMGNVALASEAFRLVESLVPARELPSSIAVNMNRGLLALATDQYGNAIQCFDAVLRIDANHISAVNNRAITLLYTCNLSKAIEALEEYIHRSPDTNLNETVVFNLCTLYELSTDRALEKKREIWKLILRHGSDSFDPSLLKL